MTGLIGKQSQPPVICYTLAVVTAFVLAGGKSTRMGADKAFLRVHDTTLLERAVGIATLAADAVYICGPREKFGTEAIEDIFPAFGPLGGIHAALKSSQSELNLVLAVDLPFVEADFLRYLLRKTEINPDSLSDNRETGVRSFTMPLRTLNRELRTSALTAVVPLASRGR